MRFSRRLAGTVCTFDLVRRRGQKRLIVTPLTQHHYRITAPRNIAQRTVENSLDKNAETILGLKPTVLPLKRMVAARQVFVFGKRYRLETAMTGSTVLTEGVLTLATRSTLDKDIEQALSKQLEIWLKAYIAELVATYATVLSAMQVSAPVIQYRTMKTKFGSCRPTQGRITLNLELIHYPMALVEYIFLHEITHFKHPDHSPSFYHTLSTLCPHHRTYKKSLDTMRHDLLYAPLDTYAPTSSMMCEPRFDGRFP
ncbi:MAG: DUF45 domain-containing protein [Acholeplasmatales bacterium]|nr:MAG: DUF45 domain-containing protein [Acholeplasmatales bacterium]